MDEVQENEPDKPVWGTEPIIRGYAIDESRFELNLIPYFDENLGKGLGSGDASSLFYNGSIFDSGGLGSSALVEGKDVYRDRVPSDDAAVDLFSSIGLPNASDDLCWGFDFTKKFPALDYQFSQVSDSWNSTMVSQSSWSSNKAVGVPESSSSQNINFQNNQPQSLMTCDVGGNYMTSFAWDPPMNANRGVNSSYSCDLQFQEYPFSNNGYFGTSHTTNNSMMASPSTSLPLQHFDASLLGEGANAVDHSLQAVAINKPPAYSYNLQNFSEVSPMDTSESYPCSSEGYLGTSSLSVQCSDINIKADDHSLLSILVNKPKVSSDQQDLSKAYIGELSETSPVDGETEASPLYSNKLHVAASPIDTRDSQHESNEGYNGNTAHGLNLLGMSYNSMFMHFSDPNLLDEDTEVDDPLWQDFLASKPVDGGEPISVLSPVDTGESPDHSSEENVAISDGIPRGLSYNSVFLRETDVSPVVEETEEDDPILDIGKPVKCRKVEARRQKGVLRPLRRCSSDVPIVKTRVKRGRREEEGINSSKRGRKEEPELQNKRHGKRVKDAAMHAHGAVLTRRSNKEILDSDDEYDPVQSNFKVGRSKRGNSGRKNNRLWTLSEVTKLVNGVSEYGVGKWTAIQRTFPGSPPSRSSLDIRDKWRNLIRTSGLRLKNMEEDEFSPKYGSLQLPKSMLERICELDRAQPYLRSDVTPTPNCRDNDLVDSSSE